MQNNIKKKLDEKAINNGLMEKYVMIYGKDI